MSRRVLHLIDHMGLGGAQTVICALLDFKEHEAHSLRTTNEKLDCKHSYTLTNRKSMFNLKCILDSYRKVKKSDIDYIQCHMPIAKAVGVFIKILPMTNVDLIFHEHGSIYRGWSFYNIFIRISDRWVSEHVTVSNKAKEFLNEVGIENENIEVIRNFADTEIFSKSKLKGFNLPKISKLDDSSFKVGYAGRITEWKGWKDFVESAKHTQKTDFLIAGDGKEVCELKEKIESSNQIHYLGYIDDIRQLFNEIDCFVIPSHWDPNPLIFYESLASGVPVIASRSDSLKEITRDGENCLEFEPENSKQLADRINEIINNKDLRQRIINQGKEFAKENNKCKFLNDFKDFYAEVES